MKVEHHVWHTERLGRAMGVRVYGHWGAPLLVFPTSGGDEWEYERQGMVEARIKDIEDKLARAEVIDPTSLSGDRVRFGATVTLMNVETSEEQTYQIVGPDEADINQGSISISAPLARALIGKEAGDELKVQLPGGARHYEIVNVEFR